MLSTQPWLLHTLKMDTNLLISPINLSLTNNRDISKLTYTSTIVNRDHIKVVEDQVDTWIHDEEDRWLGKIPSRGDSFTLHCAKDSEYISLNITIFRYGTMYNLGNVRVNIIHSCSATDMTRNFKFRYLIHQEDRLKVVSIVAKVLDIMSTTNFRECSENIYSLF